MVSIRRALVTDLADATRLFEGYLHFYERDHPREAVQGFISDRLTAQDSLIFLAFQDGTAVGIAQVYPSFSSLSLSPSWVLNDLFVLPEARGTGAGRHLLQRVCAEAGEAGAAYVALETAEDNTRAQRLYQSEGFTQETGFRHYSRATATEPRRSSAGPRSPHGAIRDEQLKSGGME